MLENMRRQFTGLMYDIKFLQSKDPKAAEANRNSSMLSVEIRINTHVYYLIFSHIHCVQTFQIVGEIATSSVSDMYVLNQN